MAIRSSTSTLVRLNAKIESVNFIKLPSPSAGGTPIADGKFIKFDSAGNAKAADNTDKVVFLNFSPGGRSDIQDIQSDPIAEYAANINIDTGGLSGIIGNGVMIGLPKANITNGASTVVGATITCGADGAVVAATTATLTLAALGTATATDTNVFGHVVRIEGNIVWFIFHSVATCYNL